MYYGYFIFRILYNNCKYYMFKILSYKFIVNVIYLEYYIIIVSEH